MFSRTNGDERHRRPPVRFLGFIYVEWGNPQERAHLQDLGIDGRIILKVVVKERNGERGLVLVCLRTWRGGGL